MYVFSLPNGIFSHIMRSSVVSSEETVESHEMAHRKRNILLFLALYLEFVQSPLFFNRVKFENKTKIILNYAATATENAIFGRPYIKICYFRGTEPAYQF